MGRVGANKDSLTAVDRRHGVAYIRVSTGEQVLSVDAQRARIEAWAKTYRINLRRVFIDEGVHGDTDPHERPGLSALLDHVSRRQLDFVVIAMRDRFSRSTMIDGFCEYYITKHGARLLSIEEDPDEPDTPQRTLLRNTLKSIAQFERELIALRTRQALATLRQKGATLGRPPKAVGAYFAVLSYCVEYLRQYGLNDHQMYQYLSEQGFPEITQPVVTFHFQRKQTTRAVTRKSKHSFREIRHWLRPFFRKHVWIPQHQQLTRLASSSPAIETAGTRRIASPSSPASSNTSAS